MLILIWRVRVTVLVHDPTGLSPLPRSASTEWVRTATDSRGRTGDRGYTVCTVIFEGGGHSGRCTTIFTFRNERSRDEG